MREERNRDNQRFHEGALVVGSREKEVLRGMLRCFGCGGGCEAVGEWKKSGICDVESCEGGEGVGGVFLDVAKDGGGVVGGAETEEGGCSSFELRLW